MSVEVKIPLPCTWFSLALAQNIMIDSGPNADCILQKTLQH